MTSATSGSVAFGRLKWRRNGMAMLLGCLCVLTIVCEAIQSIPYLSEDRRHFKLTQPEECEALSPPPNSKYWDAMGQCNVCSSTPGCGFCRSTMTCAYGEEKGPDGPMSCPDWLFTPEDCPVNPYCNLATRCDDCAGMDQCVWCSSDATCMSVEESYGSTCQTLVTETPCPAVVVPSTSFK